jgi:hypothetical protein
MAELLKIQGMSLDPSEIDVAVQKICMIVGDSRGVCDGVETHDVFINYRVGSDADLAEKLYYALKSVGIHAFLDRKCLRDGEPWADGFVKGLSSSRKIICLMSRAGLVPVRDVTRDNSFDSVLLEYQVALLIRQIISQKDRQVLLPTAKNTTPTTTHCFLPHVAFPVGFNMSRSRRRTTSSPCTWATFPKAC